MYEKLGTIRIKNLKAIQSAKIQDGRLTNMRYLSDSDHNAPGNIILVLKPNTMGRNLSAHNISKKLTLKKHFVVYNYVFMNEELKKKLMGFAAI